MRAEEIREWLAERPEIEYVSAAVCDLNGTLRGKRVPIAEVDRVLDGQTKLPISVLGVDIWGEDIIDSPLVFDSGDADGLCTLTGRGIVPVSWTQQDSVLIPLWMSDADGVPFPGDPRHALNGVLKRFADRGLTPVVATELEFYLFDPERDAPRPPVSQTTGNRLHSDNVLSLDELEHFESILNAIFAACAEQDVPASIAIAENGAGQFEVNMAHTDDVLKAGDDALLFKRVVRGVARQHGVAATFMAKPYGERSGNGFHVHVSVLDAEGRNIFDDGGPDGTTVMLHAVAGLLNTMHDAALVLAPHRNSYRRYTPNTHAPFKICWGYENRTVAVRIPASDGPARRIEHRSAGADANPYLVLAAVLGGILEGIDAARLPPDPIDGNAYEADVPTMPVAWSEAINDFRNSPEMTRIFSPQLQQMFADMKQQEWERFARDISLFEYRTYLETV